MKPNPPFNDSQFKDSQFDTEQDAPPPSALEEAYPQPMPRWFAALVVGVAAIGFTALSWYAYRVGVRQPTGEGQLLLVEADKTPTKEKPLEPGGMQFPNQDKTVYNTLSGDRAVVTAERVQPAPEQPLPRDEALAKAAVPAAPVSSSKEMLLSNKPVSMAQLAPAAGETEQVTETELPPPEPQAMPMPAPAVIAAPTPAPVPLEPSMPAVQSATPKLTLHNTKPLQLHGKHAAAPAKAAPLPHAPHATQAAHATAPGKGHAMVQLGAYRSEAEAKQAWAKMKAAHGLSGLSPTIVKADVGAKGTYYRLRAGVHDAKATCAKLTAEKQPCIVVK